jgi:hypothetical protein
MRLALERWIALAVVIATTLFLPCESASAQRRRRAEPPPAPAWVELSAMPTPSEAAPSPYRRVLTIHALSAIELNADRRLLRLEIVPTPAPIDPSAPARRRARRPPRPIRCDHPDHPRRPDPLRVVHLEAGATWREWIDLREYCWGRALDALSAGGELVVRFGPRTGGRGRFAVRAAQVEHRELDELRAQLDPIPPPVAPDPEAAARIVVSRVDTRAQRGVVLRTSVRSREGRRRAYVRPDRIQFHVVGPDGAWDCAISRGGGAAIPDLFQRLTPRGGPSYALEGRWYCPEAFRAQGIYEVTPSIELEHDGAAWDLDAITGTFVGATTFVRIRHGDRGYVERPVDLPSGGPS